MEELKNLQRMISLAAGNFNQYSGRDFELPVSFKEQVKEINSYIVIYNKYSAVIETRGNQKGKLSIYMPNQWFYIASYFTDIYNELHKYRKFALLVANKERLKKIKDNNEQILSDEELRILNTLPLSDESKRYLQRFILDYDWWGGAKTIDRGDFFVSPILTCGRLVNSSQSFVTDLCAYLADKEELVKSIINAEAGKGEQENVQRLSQQLPLQQIYYGAPGTGKSHTINEATKGEDVVRTTFHPDTDYATFVGAYKPTTIEEEVMTVIGTKAVPVENADGSMRTESKIVYEFVPQAFLQAYISAWQKIAENTIAETRKQYLVIEEINRGNCAQIFGDLFQLLDRNGGGYSEYPITADADMKRQLQKAFKGLEIANKDSINELFDGRDVVGEVLNGDILLLPNNLYIWATMNTSDQSLFPIDSAFKRRWDWQYMPISNDNEGWMIETEGKKYDWWQFLTAINAKIGSTTSSEDKKLGYFFCKANNDGIITADRFVGKVIFYIWNDVFKDYEFADSIFNDPEGSKLTFDKFYTAEGKNAKVVEAKVTTFLTNLGLQPIEDENSTIEESVPQDIVIKVNDKQVKNYNAIAYTAVEEYVRLNPNKTADEVAAVWEGFVAYNPTKFFIVTDEGRKELSPRYARYTHGVKCADGRSVWVNKDGWRRATENNPKDTVKELTDAINAKTELGITITIEQ